MSDRLNELTDLITKWGEDRFIVQNSTPFAQCRKTHEEVFELVDSMAYLEALKVLGVNPKGTPTESGVKDAIGDIYVTLVMVCACNETPLRMDLMFVSVTSYPKGPLDYLVKLVPDLFRDAIDQNLSTRITARSMVCVLVDICKEYGLDFVDCVEHAYDEIRNRTGYLRSDGVFVKEDT